jgi:hypothetical protein
MAEEEYQKQPPPSKQSNSNKARRHRNQIKANPDELDTNFKGPNETISGYVAASCGRKDKTGERDKMGSDDAARHSKLDGGMNAPAGPVFNNGNQGHNESEGHGISRNAQRVEACSFECEAGTSHSEVE